MADTTTLIVGSFELALLCAGVVLLYRLLADRQRRAALRQRRLPAWTAPLSDFFLFLFLIYVGFVAFGLGSAALTKNLNVEGDPAKIWQSAATQLGMLGGCLGFALLRRSPKPTAPITEDKNAGLLGSNSIVSGIAVFLIIVPIVVVVARGWELVLKLCHLPVDKQDLIGMFANTKSPWTLAIMITLAVVIAPITEEMVFRGGIFRYLRTRMPRWIAMLGPALVFAALHVNWSTLQGLSSLAPLLALAVVFSLAYEHTGRIGTVIVAHALFNLNTVLVVLSGARVT